jgi:hypothetical protein
MIKMDSKQLNRFPAAILVVPAEEYTYNFSITPYANKNVANMTFS